MVNIEMIRSMGGISCILHQKNDILASVRTQLNVRGDGKLFIVLLL